MVRLRTINITKNILKIRKKTGEKNTQLSHFDRKIYLELKKKLNVNIIFLR